MSIRQAVEEYLSNSDLTVDNLDDIVSGLGEKFETAVEEYLLDAGWTFDDENLKWVRFN